MLEKLKLKHIARDIDAGDLLENFFVWAVFSFVAIRVFLIATNYPQIRIEENLHIAHMLLGGLLMTAAMFIFIIFLNKEAKFISSVIGGIGFGAFIDELGKFITKNNNYHYEPAIALIYIILVIIFLASRLVEKRFNYSEEEYAVNAVEMLKQALIHDLEKNEQILALKYLAKADKNSFLIKNLENILKKLNTIPNKNPGIFSKFRGLFKNLYLIIIKNKLFNTLIISFFITFSLISLVQALFNFRRIDSFFDWGQLISTFASNVFILTGVYAIVKLSRVKAYIYFRIAVLIHIFLTQFFLFVEKQFSAIFILILGILIWNTLQYLIFEERMLVKKDVVSLDT